MLDNLMYPISNVLGLSIITFNKISIEIKVCKLSYVCGFVGLWVCGFVGLWVCGFVGWFVSYLVIGVILFFVY